MAGTPVPPHRRRPGDRVIRVERPQPQVVRVAPARLPRPLPPPQLVLVGGFAALIAVGTLLLMLPFATVPDHQTTPLEALFTATSAVCVTGLVVVDTGTHWSPFGQAVILALIQLGGLGFMSVSTLLFLAFGRRVTLRERLLLRESLGIAELGQATRLGLRIAAMTLSLEAAGALIFLLRFVWDMPLGEAVWRAVFHAVSAFNNAGFDLFGGYRSLTPYRGDALLLLATAALIVLGGISFTFLADALRVRSFGGLTLDSKLVLVSSLGLWAVGTVVFVVIEGGNARTLGLLPPPAQLLDALFLAVSARTAGFNAFDLALLQDQALFFLMALMFIGAASGSTGGGIKVNTFTLLFLAVLSAIAGKARTEAFGRELPQEQVFRALAVALLAIALVFVGAVLLAAAETTPFLPLLFEAVSAFGTVGLSTGVTPSLSDASRLVLIGLMFLGRLGPLTFALGLALRQRRPAYRFPTEEIKIG